MRTILIAQLALPLLLLLCLIVWPSRSRIGFATRLTASLAVLVALAHVGIWLFPPWWFPAAVALCLVAAAAWIVWRHDFTSTRLTGIVDWSTSALFAIAGVVGAVLTLEARQAAAPPDALAPVDLSFPLGNGHYLVVNGGDGELINAHYQSFDTSVVRLRPWRGNGYAIDIVGINSLGLRSTGLLPRDPASYRIFGVPVVAPCSGSVVHSVDGLRDMPVPEYDRAKMAGNHVVLDCSGVHVVLAHLRRGSVRAGAGDRVSAGDTLGRVGNSGGTSEPHLHMHAQRPGPGAAPMGGDPVPMRVGGRFLARGDRIASHGRRIQ
jgi:hypothetical protein